MLNPKQITLLIAFLGSTLSLFAQSTVSGTVKDTEGDPLIGVTILVKGTNNGTTTDIDGNYSLSVNQSDDPVLVFSYVGYKNKELTVGNRSTLDVTMEVDLQQLDEVVVTALGFEEKKDEIGYANTEVQGEQVVQAAETNLLNALSGKSSGVRISRNSGDPGAGSYIQIRGVNSITRNSQPLIVVDGVPISNQTRGNGNGRIAQESRLNDINPNDIESMTILKGASAAALWGTQALGGVIVITTKSGNYNQKLKVSYKGTYSLDQINRKYPLQTTFGQGNDGVWNARARDSWGDKISERSGAPDEFNTTGEYFVDQDGEIWYPIISKNSQTIYDDSNFDQIFQNGQFMEHNVSASGGNQNSTIFFSLSDLDQQGIIRNNSDYRRTTARLNAESTLSEKLVLSGNFNYTRTNSNRIRRGASSSGLYLGLLRTPADFDNSGYRGDYFSGPDAAPIENRHRSYREPLAADGTPTYNNPLWTINEQENEALVNRFINQYKLTYSVSPSIDIIARAGYDHFSETRSEFYTPGSAAGEYRTGLYGENLYTNSIFNSDLIAKGATTIGDNITANLLVGWNFNSRKSKSIGSEISNFIQFSDVNDVLRDIDNALPENRTVDSRFSLQRTTGIYTSANIGFKEYLFVNATLRGETASTFGSEASNNFFFPSVSTSFILSELVDIPFASFVKLRASYGEVGVQPEVYQTSNIFVSPRYSDEYGGSLDVSLFGNGSFVPSNSRGNLLLLPERKKEREVGADLRFLEDRMSLGVTYFATTTEDVLLDFPIANSRGYSQIYTNGAEVQNNGWEADFNYNVFQNNDWSVDFGFNYTRVRNEVTDLRGAAAVNLGGLAAVNNRAVEGHPIGILWGSRTLRDDDGNIVFDDFGFPVQDEVEGIIGNPYPDWQGAISTSVRYKNFQLRALFETFQGADIYAGTKSVLYNLGRWGDSATESTFDQNLLTSDGDVIPAGTTFRGVVHDFGNGPVALTESWYAGDGGFFGNGNDELYIEDGSWSRIRELALTYTLSGDKLSNLLSINSLEFTMMGRNLFLWTEFEGNDPDTNLNGVSVGRGIDYFNNPGTKSYVFSLLVNF